MRSVGYQEKSREVPERRSVVYSYLLPKPAQKPVSATLCLAGWWKNSNTWRETLEECFFCVAELVSRMDLWLLLWLSGWFFSIFRILAALGPFDWLEITYLGRALSQSEGVIQKGLFFCKQKDQKKLQVSSPTTALTFKERPNGL